jgi:hypothetical protein
MFGLKLKDRQEEKVDCVEQAEQGVQPVEEIAKEQTQPQPLTPEVEVLAIKEEKEKFSLAGILGKTESGMKSEFYAYQIKELMQSVGMIMPKNGVNIADIESAYGETVKYGGKQIFLTPYFYRAIKNLESKVGASSISFCSMIDYPYGESSQKARLIDVKEAFKNGMDLVTVVMPFNAYSMGGLNAEKSKLNKLCKVRKGKVGVAIGINYGEEDFRKVIKMIDGLKCAHVTLLCQGGSIDKIANAVNIIREKKFSKKVFVYSSVKTIEELSRLKSLKVDMIYSERFEEIGKELEGKFGIEL